MARNIEKDKQMRWERKQHILECALHAIAKKGVSSVEIKDIARESKISVGSVYTYFKSKDDILKEVARKGQEEYRVFTKNIAENSDMNSLDKLREICTIWLDLKSNWAYTILLQSVRSNETIHGELRDTVTRRFTRNLEPISAIIREGQENGTIKSGVPLEVAFYFVSLIQGLTLQRVPGYEIPVNIDVEGIIQLFAQKTH
ncbi:TetR/AcrR family transcriptional regulator [Niallia sp. NCCP-28]|uniref:TetR/AcrR family transcriptional regulator n=1 Tax=Niallia sp. NCCP-28 TaxID=2934712 RepID=UPI00207FC8AF|nr:TetR/AcrR family transcriptional regulator [Niallia sp. NCCP-28]GKU83035.1 TetR family transcriptional regulator [Niallia sp. NCCP-28]